VDNIFPFFSQGWFGSVRACWAAARPSAVGLSADGSPPKWATCRNAITSTQEKVSNHVVSRGRAVYVPADRLEPTPHPPQLSRILGRGRFVLETLHRRTRNFSPAVDPLAFEFPAPLAAGNCRAGTLRRPRRRACRKVFLQRYKGFAGHHRDSRHGRTFPAGGQDDRVSAPARSRSFMSQAIQPSRQVFQPGRERQAVSPRGTPSRAFKRNSSKKANTDEVRASKFST